MVPVYPHLTGIPLDLCHSSQTVPKFSLDLCSPWLWKLLEMLASIVNFVVLDSHWSWFALTGKFGAIFAW